ncbi:cell wall / vacuolar inhibitor of fructosidase 2-like [Humulus lupulus]|uniref:cell wall / vacuolar inhibitor of fructosidase 2-like n=1 Tax=Humulus lupulus TaxID=3486 RepID=UPI002B411465|nr:cell wall / vacuolar inhibitor of fructosidase 2-like [Humulus lupulus]
MATNQFSLSFLLAVFFLLLTSTSSRTTLSPSSASSGGATTRSTTVLHPTELVDGVCNQTSDYSFCVKSLYADPRTPSADSYGLAFVVFGMSYLNASSTQDLIANLSKNAKRSGGGGSGHNQPLLLTRLQRCGQDYKKAVSALEMAYNDLNSETFFELADMARVAASSAEDCQAGFEKSKSPLTARNRELKGLCEICVVVSKLFTGGT